MAHSACSRRDFLKSVGVTAAALGLGGCTLPMGDSNTVRTSKKPNIVIIFADDMGYGDLGCYGHPTIRTPNLDRMARQGMKFTQFYVGASVCTPSRAALMTGRYPIRSGLCGERRVFFPDSAGGIPDSELTIAEAVKEQGYTTACIGKWHLGHLSKYLPPNHGFDYYFGLPYSNDMRPENNAKYPPLPLIEGTETIEENPDQSQLTKRYTAKALDFIKQNRDRAFFLYFAHTFPHIPLYASRKFKDKSLRGLYGDVVQELDASVGTLLDALKKYNIDKDTFVIFTSDNGPWASMRIHGGSAGLLRGAKGSTWEGGMREPCIARWPGRIEPGSVNTDIACTMDLYATCLDIAGAELPKDRIVDGMTMLPAMLGKGSVGRDHFFYYRTSELYAVRMGPWKAHFITQAGYGEKPQHHDPPMLFNIETDPSEKYDLSRRRGVREEVMSKINALVEKHKKNLDAPPSLLAKRIKDK